MTKIPFQVDSIIPMGRKKSIPEGDLPVSHFGVESIPMDKFEKRMQRLAEIKDRRFSGSISDLARYIGKEPSYVSRMLYPAGKAGKKRIGEDSVDAIEQAFGWPKGSFESNLPIAVLFERYPLKRGIEKPLFNELNGNLSSDHQIETFATIEGDQKQPVSPLQYRVDATKFRRIYVLGKAPGGLPERIWTGGEYPVGATEEYAEIASSDPKAFICPVVGDAMFPRFMPGEYVLVQPNRPPEIEDTVLVRLQNGETMLRRLLSRRDGHVRLGAWNETTIANYREDEISWVYSVAHSVPAWMIKQIT